MNSKKNHDFQKVLKKGRSRKGKSRGEKGETRKNSIGATDDFAKSINAVGAVFRLGGVDGEDTRQREHLAHVNDEPRKPETDGGISDEDPQESLVSARERLPGHQHVGENTKNSSRRKKKGGEMNEK